MHRQNDGSIAVLLKGGRLPAWYRLSQEQQNEFSRLHVDLMLSVADRHGLQRLEGFRLIAPQDNWQRFWLIEFPSLEGAEEWIRAEMAPPYGWYGYYDYYLARRFAKERYSAWVTRPAPSPVPRDTDPHRIPALSSDKGSVVLLMLARYRPGAGALTPGERGDRKHVELMRKIAQEQGLRRLEAFQLISPIHDWHRAWIIELPSLEAVEAWVEGEESLPHGQYARREFHLTRKWSPEYFASWAHRK